MKFRARFFAAFGIVFVVILVLFFVLATSVLSSNSRQDCKTQYNAILGGPVTVRDNLTAQVTSLNGDLQAQLGAVLLSVQAGDRTVSPATVQRYTDTQSQLETKRSQLANAIAKVDSLPTINTASTKGFTFDGTHYPACPS